MSINSNTPFGGAASVAIVFGLVQMVFWAVIGWRAMRAHENMAASLDSLSRHLRLRDEAKPSERSPGS